MGVMVDKNDYGAEECGGWGWRVEEEEEGGSVE